VADLLDKFLKLADQRLGMSGRVGGAVIGDGHGSGPSPNAEPASIVTRYRHS
jgi:hypothetical protein